MAKNPSNTGDDRLWENSPAYLDAGGGDPTLWPRQTTVCVALDDVWGDNAIDLALLDTQGWEPEVLHGAERALRERGPIAVFEWWPRALDAGGVDSDGFLDSLRGPGNSLSVVPREASGYFKRGLTQGSARH